ncbi:MAG: DUF1926 domain-containing protein, partial [Calditerrivibrio sp.]|nr:DUF1926 domain-containing protein [Calditerrivibrio sp.]
LVIEKLIGFVKKTEYAEFCELFVKGSHWKNFFIKYPESNHIHKRVLDISRRIEDGQSNDKLEDILFRAECNDVFWHGIFGGIYLPNLRDNAFRYIIEAEKLLDDLNGNLDGAYFKDILFDGYGCFIMKNSFISAIFTLKHGGQLKSFDIRKGGMNLVNTLSRRWEGYHDKLIKEEDKDFHDADTGITTIHEMGVTLSEDLKKEIAFDWYDRNCFVDHFVEKFNAEDMKSSSYRELGDFVNQPFKHTFENGSLCFKRVGGIYLDEKFESYVEKRFSLIGKKLSFQYDISTNYKKNIFYVLEMNFHFYDYDNLLINGKGIKMLNRLKSGNIEISFDGYSMNIGIDKEAKPFLYKVNTVHQSEQGVDFTVQGISLIFPFNMKEKLRFSGYVELNEVL